MYKDFDALFERFSIMTVDGNLTDQEVLNYLFSRTSLELFNLLVEKIKK